MSAWPQAFYSYKRFVHVMKGNCMIAPFTAEFMWSRHHFCINRLYRFYEDTVEVATLWRCKYIYYYTIPINGLVNSLLKLVINKFGRNQRISLRFEPMNRSPNHEFLGSTRKIGTDNGIKF